MAQRLAGRNGEAGETFERGIRQFPLNASFYQEYGLLLAKVGDSGDEAARSRSADLFRKALDLDASLSSPTISWASWLWRKEILMKRPGISNWLFDWRPGRASCATAWSEPTGDWDASSKPGNRPENTASSRPPRKPRERPLSEPLLWVFLDEESKKTA